MHGDLWTCLCWCKWPFSDRYSFRVKPLLIIFNIMNRLWVFSGVLLKVELAISDISRQSVINRHLALYLLCCSSLSCSSDHWVTTLGWCGGAFLFLMTELPSETRCILGFQWLHLILKDTIHSSNVLRFRHVIQELSLFIYLKVAHLIQFQMCMCIQWYFALHSSDWLHHK